jgi:4-amino-4-deoxy-L-arabinose transferase-like glycosyltransferase
MLFLGSALLETRKRSLIAAAVLAGLAVLAKGPLGIVLPGLVGIGWALQQTTRTRSLAWARRFPWFRAALLGLLVALPWYVAAYAMNGMAVVRSQLLHENFHQFTGANARMDLLYYLEPWLSDSLPWNLLAMAGVWRALKQRERGPKFCALWWAVFMVVFTLSAYKRRAYILPALPASSMLVGYWLDAILPETSAAFDRLGPWLRLRWKAFTIAAGVAAGLGVLALRWPAVHALIGVDLPDRDGAITGIALLLFAVAAAWVVHALRARDAWTTVIALWVLLASLYVGVVVTGETVAALRKSPKPTLQRILRDLPPGGRLTVCGLGDDPTMPLLLYFPDPDLISIIPQRAPAPAPFPPGYYLLGRDAWASVQDPGDWRVLWTGELIERSKRKPMLMAEKWTMDVH